jgi:hypothetical protein
MDIEHLVKSAPAITGWVSSVIGWIAAFVQWRKKRKSEAELKLIRRRGEAPYLTPSEQFFQRLYVGGSEREAQSAAPATVLCATSDQVPKEVSAGTPIRLVVDNKGKSARRVTVSLDGRSIHLREEPPLPFANGLAFLEYPYDPRKHGQDQRLVIDFETEAGVQDRHTYVLKHGIRWLSRRDPP